MSRHKAGCTLRFIGRVPPAIFIFPALSLSKGKISGTIFSNFPAYFIMSRRTKIASLISMLILILVLFYIFNTWPTETKEEKETSRDQDVVSEEISEKTEVGETDGLDNGVSVISKNSPYYHKIYFARSLDGETWTQSSQPIVEHASVPDIIELEQSVADFSSGTLLSYFVDTTKLIDSTWTEEISLTYSTDSGETWSEKESITIEGKGSIVAVDPSIVQTQDGTLWLYYFDLRGMHPEYSPEGEDKYAIYVATSTDGRTFSQRQAVITSNTGLRDPDVVYRDGTWFLYVPTKETKEGEFTIATSTDGLNFTRQGTLNFSLSPEAVSVGDIIYVYTCTKGVPLRVSSNDGIHFSEAESLRSALCSLSPIVLDDGTYGGMVMEFQASQ